MSAGTFVTGIEIQDALNSKPQQLEDKPKIPERALLIPQPKPIIIKTTRALVPTTPVKVPQRSASLPKISQSQREPKSLLKSIAAENSFHKPLFKRIGDVSNFYEKLQNEEKKKNAGKRDNSMPEKQITFVDAFEVLISKDFDELYREKKSGAAIESLKELLKKKTFNIEVEKEEQRIHLGRKRCDELRHENEQLDKQIGILKEKLGELELQVEDNGNLVEKLNQIKKELEECQEDLVNAEYKSEILTESRKKKKDWLTTIKKRVEVAKQNIVETVRNIHIHKKGLAVTKYVIERGHQKENNMKEAKDGNESALDTEFEQMLEHGINEFEDRRKLKELLKHERILEEEQKKEIEEEERKAKKKKDEEARREWEKEERKRRSEQSRLIKQKEKFLDFLKVTPVKNVQELPSRLLELQESMENHQKKIEEEESVNESLKRMLNSKLLELKNVSMGNNRAEVSEFDYDPRLDNLEETLVHKKNSVNHVENEIVKLNRIVTESCLSVSRILHQLQKGKTNKAVDTSSVLEILSVCGLKLERMLTVVIKKKKNFFMESINTDGTFKEDSENFPPPYMGLNYKPVVKNIPEDSAENENTNDDEVVEKIRENVKRIELAKQMEAKHIEAQH